MLEEVAAYYEAKLATHGPSPAGVDWNSATSQALRFDQLLRLVVPEAPVGSINDYGCGYGALADYLTLHHPGWAYCGFDISARMIMEAERLHGGQPRRRFVSDRKLMSRADYTVASGIFNVKLSAADEDWCRHILATLDDLATLSDRGFAFNVLTSFVEPSHRRANLYYANPLFLFQHCRDRFSKHVALLHDYPLFEFTMLVRL